jgi:hypothetical protein
MKKIINHRFYLLAAITLVFALPSQAQKNKPVEPEIVKTNIAGQGNEIVLTVTPGEAHNHPLMVAWVEDGNGNYVQTLYVSESVAKGFFKYADNSEGKWKPGKLIRPAALPVWAHSRGVASTDGHYMPTMENPVPDAYTSATPKAGFVLDARSDVALPQKIKILFEINQSWDWNEFWTNSKFPDDDEYKSSSQPSLIYAVEVNLSDLKENYQLKPIGHGHYNGSDGAIDPDLKTITTALEIVKEVSVVVKAKK